MSFVVGSFNMQKLGERTIKQKKKDFAKIAEIIRNEKFDLIAFQEVFKKDPIEHLLNFLGKQHWDYRFERAHPSDEGYAFLWHRRRFRLADDSEPRICNQVKKGSIVRNPYVGRFTPATLGSSPFCEIRIINTHIHYGSNGYNDRQKRINEYKLIAGEIHTRENTKRYKNFRPAYTLVMGDYNLLPRDCDHIHQTDDFLIRSEGRLLALQQRQDTTIHNGAYKNSFDHFTYDADRVGNLVHSVEHVDAPRKYFNGDLEKYSKDVSDHLPVKINLNFRLG